MLAGHLLRMAVYFSRSDNALQYPFWRGQAISMGSSRALTMKLDDQLQPYR